MELGYSFIPKNGFKVTLIEKNAGGYQYDDDSGEYNFLFYTPDEYVFYVKTPHELKVEKVKKEVDGFERFAYQLCQLFAMNEKDIKTILYAAINNKTGFKLEDTTYLYVSNPIPCVHLFTYNNGEKLYLIDDESDEWNKLEDELFDNENAIRKYNQSYKDEGIDMSNSEFIKHYIFHINHYALTIELI